jgi:hypothetical protein
MTESHERQCIRASDEKKYMSMAAVVLGASTHTARSLVRAGLPDVRADSPVVGGAPVASAGQVSRHPFQNKNEGNAIQIVGS